MPFVDLITALGLLVAAALAAVTVLAAVLFGLARLELATVPVRRRYRPGTAWLEGRLLGSPSRRSAMISRWTSLAPP